MKRVKPLTHRIYYDEHDLSRYVVVKCSAYKGPPIKLVRRAIDVSRATAGCTYACMNAHMVGRVGAEVLPFAPLFTEFTKTSAYIVDKMKHGIPVHCVWFTHGNGADVDHHDRHSPESILASGRAEKTIVLRAPRVRVGGPEGVHTQSPRTQITPRRQPLYHGARSRAKKAGLFVGIEREAA